MLNMHLFFKRIVTVHVCIVLMTVICAGVLNYLLWTHTPDTRFETLESLLLPFVRPLVSLATISLAVAMGFDIQTVRVIRKMAYYKRT